MDVARSIAVVVGGGSIRPPGRSFDDVIAADSGLDVALAAGLSPTLVVGDLDSVSTDGLAWAAAHQVPVESHPADKDDTDTALAIRRALDLGVTDLVMLGSDMTARLDHLLGSLLCLGDAVLHDVGQVSAQMGGTVVHVVHPGHRMVLHLAIGRVFSLLAMHGDCCGVDVVDARWTLTDAHLPSGSSLGISNESLGRPTVVSVTEGVLTIIVPEVAS
jgi:thiamine pyrophosphokinase